MNALKQAARLALCDLLGRPEQPREAVIENLEKALAQDPEAVIVKQILTDIRNIIANPKKIGYRLKEIEEYIDNNL